MAADHERMLHLEERLPLVEQRLEALAGVVEQFHGGLGDGGRRRGAAQLLDLLGLLLGEVDRGGAPTRRPPLLELETTEVRAPCHEATKTIHLPSRRRYRIVVMGQTDSQCVVMVTFPGEKKPVPVDKDTTLVRHVRGPGKVTLSCGKHRDRECHYGVRLFLVAPHGVPPQEEGGTREGPCGEVARVIRLTQGVYDLSVSATGPGPRGVDCGIVVTSASGAPTELGPWDSYHGSITVGRRKTATIKIGCGAHGGRRRAPKCRFTYAVYGN